MFVEINGNAIRNKSVNQSLDKNYLTKYYNENNQYPLFSQVLIETRTDCNKNCNFCPQFHYKRKLEIMKWNTFVKIINSLLEIDFCGRVALLVSNEPLLEKRLIKMIEYARKKSANFFLDITTNGKILTIEYIEKLLLAGIDNININDYRNEKQISEKQISKHLQPIVEKYKFNPKISYKPRSSSEVLPNYAGVISQKNNTKEFGFCNFPFRKLVFSVHGDVLLCCNDFKYQTNFGNIKIENLLNIWYSDNFNNFRKNLLNDKRIGLCSECNDFQSYSI